MGLLRFVAIRALIICGSSEMIVRAPLIFAPLGMAPLWIRHGSPLFSPRSYAREFYGVFDAIAIVS
jgi:hypothetical protein